MPNDISFRSKPKWIQKNCEICEVEFWVPPSRNTERRNKRFCSRKCLGHWQSNRLLAEGKGENSRGYKHGGFTNKGYIYKLKKHIHGKKQDRYRLVHKDIAEKVLGRKLKNGEVVHHIDCNKSNNNNDNLLICERGYHSWLHWKMSEMYGQVVLSRKEGD